MKRIRILLADDHRLLRMGLATLISFHPDLEVVGEAADGGWRSGAHRSSSPMSS